MEAVFDLTIPVKFTFDVIEGQKQTRSAPGIPDEVTNIDFDKAAAIDELEKLIYSGKKEFDADLLASAKRYGELNTPDPEDLL